MKLSSRLFALAFVAPLMLIGCSDDDTSESGTTPATDSGTKVDTGSTTTDTGASTDTGTVAAKDIVDTAVAAGSFKTLVAAVQAAGLESALRGTGPFTVFAPTDDAFAKIPSFLTTKLLTAPYKTELGLILKYHVLAASVKAADVLGKKSTPDTLIPGVKISVDGSDGKTVVINGGSKVSAADVMASNGVIHVVDGVLLPTIVDTAVGYDDGTTTFKTLVTAVGAADLGATLSGPGTFTVFAPTDKAFADLKTAIGDTAFNAILADKAKLGAILKYHVLGAVAYAKDVKTGDVTTVEGSKAAIAVGTDGKVVITDGTGAKANVIMTDLPTSNGVIHVIDKVILPPAK